MIDVKTASGLVLHSSMCDVNDDSGFHYTKIGLQCYRECFAVAGININEIESKEQYHHALRSVIDNQKRVKASVR